MSYCVHCGVELHDSARACPLCHTPVVDPSKLGSAPPELPPYPTQRAEVPPASKREAALLLTVMLLSVAICCGLLNLFLGRSVPWSAYVIGGAALLWVWVAIPLWFRALPLAVRLILDGVAVGLYVLVIALLADGMVWFKALALPIVLLATAVLLLLGLTLPGRSILSSLSLIFGAVFVAAGAIFTVESVSALCSRLGVPQRILSVTVVALGTSLPELVTAIVSARKGEGELSLGNILGANAINGTLILGLSACVAGGLTLDDVTRRYTLFFALALTALLIFPVLFFRRTSRLQGLALAALYAAAMYFSCS